MEGLDTVDNQNRKLLKILAYALSILLLASVINVLGTASCFSQNKSSTNHPFQLFYERRCSQFNEFPVLSDGIVFLGDSLTDEARWNEIFPGLKTFNRGVSADRTEHVLARLDQITKAKPYMIFIMIGTNDLRYGVKQETIISNYRKILTLIKNKSPKTTIFVQSLLPRRAEFQERIESINDELFLLSKESDCAYINLYSAFLDKDGSIKNEYSNDELHLLGAGYLKWKELIEPYIKLDDD